MNEPEAKTIAEGVQARMHTLRDEWHGRPMVLEDVLANVVFWGAVLTKFYPEAIEAAQSLIAKTDVSGQTMERNKAWN